jgi:hypothetical protein
MIYENFQLSINNQQIFLRLRARDAFGQEAYPIALLMSLTYDSAIAIPILHY